MPPTHPTHPTRPTQTRAGRRVTWLAFSLLVGALLPSEASATGMQGHVYVSQCTRETLVDGELKRVLDAYPEYLSAGSYFPDTGYAAGDPYGELAHWDPFVEGYVRYLRARFAPPYTEGEAGKHLAFLLGVASHGMVDQTFDILFFDKSTELEGPKQDLDTSMDVFLVADKNRRFVPSKPLHDAAALSEIFAAAPFERAVTAETFDRGASLARAALSFVVTTLSKKVGEHDARSPWAHARYLDHHTPGAYPRSGDIVARYWQTILDRVASRDVADTLVVGTSPLAGERTLGTSSKSLKSLDGYVTLFTGIGVEPGSVTAESFYLHDADGEIVPTDIRLRGEPWATTLQLKPRAELKPDAAYTAVLTRNVVTLEGKHPTRDFTLLVRTRCASPGSPGCPAAPAPNTASECPRTDHEFDVADAGTGEADREGDAAPGRSADGGTPAAATAVSPSTGCAVARAASAPPASDRHAALRAGVVPTLLATLLATRRSTARRRRRVRPGVPR